MPAKYPKDRPFSAKNMKQNLILYPEFHWESVEFHEDWRDVAGFLLAGDNTSHDGLAVQCGL